MVFYPPASVQEPEFQGKVFLKRVVAVGGDRVEVRRGRLVLNGAAVTEPYLREQPKYTLKATQVPPGHLLLLGDNR